MHYIIFDLEWNQPANETALVTTPLYLPGEIVEIGAVKLDGDFRVVDEQKLYVTPKYYTKMHRQIAALTGIRDKDLAQKGLPFPQAYAAFTDWCGEEYTYLTWSMSDMPMLIDNMLLHGLDVSRLPDCCDIQRIFGREIMRSSVRYSLDAAIGILGEKGDTAHDALHDARNTAKVCSHLDLEQYIAEYTGRVFTEQPLGTLYDSRSEVLGDAALLTFECPWCGQTVRCDPWLNSGGGECMAYGSCPDGDEFLLQLSIARHPDKRYSVKRIFFEMSDDLWEIYMDKKEALGV